MTYRWSVTGIFGYFSVFTNRLRGRINRSSALQLPFVTMGSGPLKCISVQFDLTFIVGYALHNRLVEYKGRTDFKTAPLQSLGPTILHRESSMVLFL